MATHSDQCAVAADGSLLDTSKIIFYNDPVDDNPLPNANSDTTSTNLQVQLFIQGGPAPGKMAAGSRWSLRVPSDEHGNPAGFSCLFSI